MYQWICSPILFSFNIDFCHLFKKEFIYFFIEREEGRKKERERNIHVREKHQSVTSRMPQTGDLAHDLSMSFDRKSNQSPFCLQPGTQSVEPHQPGCSPFLGVFLLFCWWFPFLSKHFLVWYSPIYLFFFGFLCLRIYIQWKIAMSNVQDFVAYIFF